MDLWLWTLFKVSLILLSAGVCCHVAHFIGISILEELAGPIFRLPLREFYFW
jgi:hypothetical protein